MLFSTTSASVGRRGRVAGFEAKENSPKSIFGHVATLINLHVLSASMMLIRRRRQDTHRNKVRAIICTVSNSSLNKSEVRQTKPHFCYAVDANAQAPELSEYKIDYGLFQVYIYNRNPLLDDC
jgi:hypothetical protein